LHPRASSSAKSCRGMLGATESTVAWLFRSNLVHFNLAKPSFMDIYWTGLDFSGKLHDGRNTEQDENQNGIPFIVAARPTWLHPL
jgi:hypothetical protein